MWSPSEYWVVTCGEWYWSTVGSWCTSDTAMPLVVNGAKFYSREAAIEVAVYLAATKKTEDPIRLCHVREVYEYEEIEEATV